MSRKRKGVTRQGDVTPWRRSMVQVQIGNRTYDAVYSPTCKTCTHPARMLIEEKLIEQWSFRAIAAMFSGKEIEEPSGRLITMPKVSHMSIYNHFREGHMPLEAATLRKLADRRAQQVGSNYEEAAEQFVDHMTLAEAVVHRAYGRLVAGEIEPEVRDGLAAAKFLQDVETGGAGGGLDAEAWSQAMTVYFETARSIMDPDMWMEFTSALAANPILRAIERRLSPGAAVVDAEVVPQVEGVPA